MNIYLNKKQSTITTGATQNKNYARPCEYFIHTNKATKGKEEQQSILHKNILPCYNLNSSMVSMEMSTQVYKQSSAA
jgi:hypothetical protein